jgi:hypothetical protein
MNLKNIFLPRHQLMMIDDDDLFIRLDTFTFIMIIISKAVGRAKVDRERKKRLS